MPTIESAASPRRLSRSGKRGFPGGAATDGSDVAASTWDTPEASESRNAPTRPDLQARASTFAQRAGYSAKTSQPRYMRLSTASVTKAVACAASANVYGPGCTASCVPTGKTSASTTQDAP